MKNLQILIALTIALFLNPFNESQAQVQIELNPYLGEWGVLEGQTDILYGADVYLLKPIRSKTALKVGLGIGRVNYLRSRDLRIGYNLLDFYGGVAWYTKENLQGFYGEALINPGMATAIIKAEGNKLSISEFTLGVEFGVGYKVAISDQFNIGFRSATNFFTYGFDGDLSVKFKGSLTIAYTF